MATRQKLTLQTLITLIALCVVSGLSAAPSLADVPTQLEPEYAEAVLAFNGRKYGRALKLLDQLIKRSPQTVEFLELKALSLKVTKDNKKSAQTYIQLIKTKKKANAPAKELAPYYFELGMILYTEKKLNHARTYLERSSALDFNKPASDFFLGMIAMQDERKQEALVRFEQVLKSDQRDFFAASHFYAGLLSSQIGSYQGASSHFKKAEAEAEIILKSEKSTNEQKQVAQKIAEASRNALAPMDKSTWFGNAAILGGYDTNVLQYPSSVGSTSGTNQASAKGNLQLGIGYISSPSNTFQFLPSYQGSFDYLLNRDVRDGEYYSQSLSLYVTKDPLESTNIGAKLEGNLIFKRNADTINAYMLEGKIGPYFRTQVSTNSTLNFEATIAPNRFFDDTTTTDSFKLSGSTWNIQGTWQKIGSRLFNPSMSILVTYTETDGTEFQSIKGGVGFGNQFILSPKSTLSVGLDLSITKYNWRTDGQRNDQMAELYVSFNKKLGERWTFVSNGTFTYNNSNVTDQYKYDRLLGMIGVNYAIFRP